MAKLAAGAGVAICVNRAGIVSSWRMAEISSMLGAYHQLAQKVNQRNIICRGHGGVRETQAAGSTLSSICGSGLVAEQSTNVYMQRHGVRSNGINNAWLGGGASNGASSNGNQSAGVAVSAAHQIYRYWRLAAAWPCCRYRTAT